MLLEVKVNHRVLLVVLAKVRQLLKVRRLLYQLLSHHRPLAVLLSHRQLPNHHRLLEALLKALVKVNLKVQVLLEVRLVQHQNQNPCHRRHQFPPPPLNLNLPALVLVNQSPSLRRLLNHRLRRNLHLNHLVQASPNLKVLPPAKAQAGLGLLHKAQVLVKANLNHQVLPSQRH